VRQVVGPLKRHGAVEPISRRRVFEAGTSIFAAAVGWGGARNSISGSEGC
jgi:hypothetical protein